MDIALSPHARARMQQRCISPAAIEVLLDFGRMRHVHSDGRELVYFDKKARAQLLKANPAAARAIDRLGRTYAVLADDGCVVTVGHRYRRIPRD
jgi:hypothetical protein